MKSLREGLGHAVRLQTQLADSCPFVLKPSSKLLEGEHHFAVEHDVINVLPDDFFFSNGAKHPDSVVGNIAYGLIKALQAAHERKFPHGLVAPRTVCLTRSGDFVLTDFGIATAYLKAIPNQDFGRLALSNNSQTTGGLGNAICWEVLQDHEEKNLGRILAFQEPNALEARTYSKPNVKSDILALGILIYLLSEGVHPFNLSIKDEVGFWFCGETIRSTLIDESPRIRRGRDRDSQKDETAPEDGTLAEQLQHTVKLALHKAAKNRKSVVALANGWDRFPPDPAQNPIFVELPDTSKAQAPAADDTTQNRLVALVAQFGHALENRDLSTAVDTDSQLVTHEPFDKTASDKIDVLRQKLAALRDREKSEIEQAERLIDCIRTDLASGRFDDALEKTRNPSKLEFAPESFQSQLDDLATHARKQLAANQKTLSDNILKLEEGIRSAISSHGRLKPFIDPSNIDLQFVWPEATGSADSALIDVRVTNADIIVSRETEIQPQNGTFLLPHLDDFIETTVDLIISDTQTFQAQQADAFKDRLIDGYLLTAKQEVTFRPETNDVLLDIRLESKTTKAASESLNLAWNPKRLEWQLEDLTKRATVVSNLIEHYAAAFIRQVCASENRIFEKHQRHITTDARTSKHIRLDQRQPPTEIQIDIDLALGSSNTKFDCDVCFEQKLHKKGHLTPSIEDILAAFESSLSEIQQQRFDAKRKELQSKHGLRFHSFNPQDFGKPVDSISAVIERPGKKRQARQVFPWNPDVLDFEVPDELLRRTKVENPNINNAPIHAANNNSSQTEKAETKPPSKSSLKKDREKPTDNSRPATPERVGPAKKKATKKSKKDARDDGKLPSDAPDVTRPDRPAPNPTYPSEPAPLSEPALSAPLSPDPEVLKAPDLADARSTGKSGGDLSPATIQVEKKPIQSRSGKKLIAVALGVLLLAASSYLLTGALNKSELSTTNNNLLKLTILPLSDGERIVVGDTISCRVSGLRQDASPRFNLESVRGEQVNLTESKKEGKPANQGQSDQTFMVTIPDTATPTIDGGDYDLVVTSARDDGTVDLKSTKKEKLSILSKQGLMKEKGKSSNFKVNLVKKALNTTGIKSWQVDLMDAQSIKLSRKTVDDQVNLVVEFSDDDFENDEFEVSSITHGNPTSRKYWWQPEPASDQLTGDQATAELVLRAYKAFIDDAKATPNQPPANSDEYYQYYLSYLAAQAILEDVDLFKGLVVSTEASVSGQVTRQQIDDLNSLYSKNYAQHNNIEKTWEEPRPWEIAKETLLPKTTSDGNSTVVINAVDERRQKEAPFYPLRIQIDKEKFFLVSPPKATNGSQPRKEILYLSTKELPMSAEVLDDLKLLNRLLNPDSLSNGILTKFDYPTMRIWQDAVRSLVENRDQLEIDPMTVGLFGGKWDLCKPGTGASNTLLLVGGCSKVTDDGVWSTSFEKLLKSEIEDLLKGDFESELNADVANLDNWLSAICAGTNSDSPENDDQLKMHLLCQSRDIERSKGIVAVRRVLRVPAYEQSDNTGGHN